MDGGRLSERIAEMPATVRFQDSRRKLLPGSRVTGDVDLSQTESITIRARSRGSFKELENFVLREANKLPRDRRYFSREQLAAEYGANPEDLDRLEAYAHRHNLSTTQRSAAQRSLVMRGTIGDLLTAFPTRVHMYQHSTGSYRGREELIKIPASLAPIITGIFGFDTRPRSRSGRHERVKRPPPAAARVVPAAVYAQRYHFPAKARRKALDGAGQTIALIELGGSCSVPDLERYFHAIATPLPTVSAISVDHGANRPHILSPVDAEVMMDIEVAGGVAPAAKIAVYFAPSNGDRGFIDAISAAVHDAERKPDVISVSWGCAESDIDKQAVNAYHELFLEAAALGVTICVSSGDHGAAQSAAADWDKKVHVDHPASDPFVLACGGTQLDETNDDCVWNDGTAFDKSVKGGGGWASGGGISRLFSVPKYQARANRQKSIVKGQAAGRGVPDIAMSAVNYFTYFHNRPFKSGGTSAVAPLMAGLIVRLNQATGKNVGFLNPFLYANATKGVVRDVTKGTNAIKDTLAGYHAKKGWDACTGLGTPNGAAILSLL